MVIIQGVTVGLLPERLLERVNAAAAEKISPLKKSTGCRRC